MLVKLEDSWINPDHVMQVVVSDEMQTRVDMSDGTYFLCILPPDEVAAILNGEPDELDENDWHGGTDNAAK